MVGLFARNREAAAYASRLVNRLQRAKKEGGEDEELLSHEEEICILYDALYTAIEQEEAMRGHPSVDIFSELGDASQKIYDEFRRFVGENLPQFNAELRRQMN